MIGRVDFLLRVTLGQLVGGDDVLLELVERDLSQEDVVGDVVRPLQPAAVHVVREDGLEALLMTTFRPPIGRLHRD